MLDGGSAANADDDTTKHDNAASRNPLVDISPLYGATFRWL